MSIALHTSRKLRSTLWITFMLAMARTFGRYEVSVSGFDGLNYAIYRWRGRRWGIPTTPLDPHDD